MTYSNVCYSCEVLIALAASSSGNGRFGDGVFVPKEEVADNASGDWALVIVLDWAKSWFMFAFIYLSKVLWTREDLCASQSIYCMHVPKCMLLFV